MPIPEASSADGVGEVLPVGLRFELFVDDVRASVDFYGSTLGLVPPHDWSADGYVPLRSGAVTIGVQHHGKLPAGHHFTPERLAGSRGVGLEIVIEVDDVDRVAARARRRTPRATVDGTNRSATNPGLCATSGWSIRTATT